MNTRISEGTTSSQRICKEVAEVPHTQGKLERYGVRIYGTEKPSRLIATMGVGDKDTEDARRLVACWNACDGIPTESIEGDLKSLLMGAVRRTNAAEARRDEMLIALQLIEHATAPTHDDGGYHENAHELARAAIAKAVTP